MRKSMLAFAAVACFASGFSGASEIADLVNGSKENRCSLTTLKGRYIFTATGYTRAPTSLPGTPWTPKAILELLEFNGDGTLKTPGLVVANPFGDLGNVLQPPSGGADGMYALSGDCNGTVQFADAAGVTFRIYVEPPKGDTIFMIQTVPANNVFQGTATRLF